jgi:hypothetical protein
MNINKNIRIGMICPFWLPSHGGGEQYDYRLASELIKHGFNVQIFTATPAKDGKDNGLLDVTRNVNHGDAVYSSWGSSYREPKGNHLKSLMTHYELMNEAVKWCVTHNIQVALIGNPWQQTELVHVRELYSQLKILGIKTGLIHFDLAPIIERSLLKIYQRTRTWSHAKKEILRAIKKVKQEKTRLHAFYSIGSPLFFEPDFIISSSVNISVWK